MPLKATDFNIVGDNVTSADLGKFSAALGYLQQSPAAAAMLQQLADNLAPINILHVGGDGYKTDTAAINWNPNEALTVIDPTDMNGSIGVRSPAVALIHEASHYLDPNNNGTYN
jgi:hypothetical protein